MIKNIRATVPLFTSTTYSLLLVLVLASQPIRAYAETVTIFHDQVPQIVFAAGDVRAALEGRGFTVEVKGLTTLSNSHSGKKVVIALSNNSQVTQLLTAQGGTALPTMIEQAYSIRTTATPGNSYWVVGGDNNGAMYGGLQIAEYIKFDGFGQAKNENDTPHLKSRGIKFNIPLDREAPTYFSSTDGTSHKEAIRNVWDMKFWTVYFDEMARHRYNVLSLWNPHPFTSMLKMSDYPDVAINGVETYDENDRPVTVNSMTIDQKITFWKDVMKYGRERGFGIYFCTWNIFLSSAENKYGLTDSPTDQDTKTYLKKCMKQFLSTYPDLAGFGVTVGENMGGISDEDKEKWAWDTYGSGMLEYAKENPSRQLVFIHRHHDGDLDQIVKYFKPLNDLSNVRLDMSFKYSQAHAHAAAKPSYWNQKGMSETLDQHNLKSWLTIRNDDFYFLPWGDAKFVKEYIKGFPQVGKYVDAFYIGADGWVFSREWASKDPYFKNKNALSIEKTWYMQKLWGRISYNPEVDVSLFKKHLANKFPQGPSDNGETLFNAWSDVSRALQVSSEQVTGTWDLDFDWWPENWTSKDDGFLTLQKTRPVESMDGSSLASFKNTASGNLSGKTSAFTTAATIEQLANSTLSHLATMSHKNNKEFELALKDLEAMSYLGLYNANKFRAAIYLEQNKNTDAKNAIGRAYGYWLRYSTIMDGLYTGATMQRNRDFANWRANDAAALKDYTDLGGHNLTVSFVSPADRATFAAPANVSVEVNATNANGSIQKVELWVNGIFNSSDSTASYKFALSNLAAGNYTFEARAYDSAGGFTSRFIMISVTGSTPPPSVPPTPAKPTVSSTTSSTPTLSGTTSPNAIITIYDNGKVIGTATANNSSGVWSFTVSPPLSVGTHEITVTAMFSGGAESASSPSVTVTVSGGGAGAVPWTEDFTLPNGTKTDTGSTSWTATRPSGIFEVSENRLMVSGDSREEAEFRSGAINISAGKVDIQVDVVSAGGLEDAEDYVKMYAIIDGGSERELGSLVGIQTLTALKGTGLQGSTLQIIIRARQTNAAEFYYIDNLKVTTTSAPPVNTPPTISSLLDTSVEVNKSTEAISFVIGDKETAAGSLTVTATSSNTGLVPVSAIVLGGSGANRTIKITPASGKTGTATITVTVSDGASTAKSTFVLTVTSSSPTITVKINFQPSSAPAVAGYGIDSGVIFGARSNGYSYGWNYGLTSDVRDRNSSQSANQLYDTMILPQKDLSKPSKWEISLPNGTYSVRVVAGDPDYYSSDMNYNFKAEGVVILNAKPTIANRWVEDTDQVVVNDGRLTLENGSSAVRNRLCFIEISQITGVNN